MAVEGEQGADAMEGVIVGAAAAARPPAGRGALPPILGRRSCGAPGAPGAEADLPDEAVIANLALWQVRLEIDAIMEEDEPSHPQRERLTLLLAAEDDLQDGANSENAGEASEEDLS